MNFANLDTAQLDSLAKFHRTMKKAGIDLSDIMQSPAKRRNLKEYADMGFPRVDNKGAVIQPTLPEGEELARLILDKDLITSRDIEANTDIRYTDEQHAYAVETMPTDPETLKSIKDDDCMLIFGPSKDLTVLGVRDLYNQLFYSKTDGWYAEDKEKFARTDVVKAGKWMIVRKSPVVNSTSKNWDEQQSMLTEGNRIPNAAEMSYAVTVYYKVRGTYLLKSVYVRTSSVFAGGGRVSVGHFASAGLLVNDDWDSYRLSTLGVASARE